jgi:hypothetical protein
MTQDLCNLCAKLFSDPYLIGCGHSFDKQCIEEYIRHSQEEEQLLKCPICHLAFDSNKLIKNFQLADLLQALQEATKATIPVHPPSTNDANNNLTPSPTYEIYLLDISKSMRWSDRLIKVFGESRFEIARRILTQMFESK